MATDKQHIRHCILYEFQQGKNASEARESLCSFLGADVVSYETCNYWYRRFRSGDFDLSDQPRPGQPRKFTDAELQALLDEDSTRTQQELAARLGVTRTAISKRLRQMGKIQKLGRVKRERQADSHDARIKHRMGQSSERSNNRWRQDNLKGQMTTSGNRGGRKDNHKVPTFMKTRRKERKGKLSRV